MTTTQPEKRLKSKRKATAVRMFFSYILLVLVALITIAPFIWTISTSLKGPGDAIFSMPPQFIPSDFTLNNFKTVWTSLPIPMYLINSMILTFFGVVLPLFFSSIAAFPLARMEFKGKNFIFMLIIGTMMIPNEVTMIPIYLIIDMIGLLGTHTGIIITSIITPIGIFLMRQGFKDIPREIEESAVLDGANVWQIFWHLLFPMVKPMLGVLAILSFIGSWNNFLWPLLILNDPNKYPITLGLYQLQGTFAANTRLVAAGAVIALIPIMTIFISFQRYFIEAAYSSSVKG
ncbi:lactose ABC transporter permease [Halolactibacillus alkaliphilus]|uniref:Lactose ABC transporter permease n=1 Tax=Halolactibacillus alkaliphilus TaxID=442899 RepID=A0A511WZP7_9BACI|nr:carbohydrate ABC transporter permease [Halolactibacillus alkaliphilus]GEN56161.1 lactose ABC transporter permease [Halolactibacillus alkaliphilus]GGN66816.1 lactose ABC transporter permease [Halolactibacillus alkaliphilus]SFO72071.1 putative chitobiose transport system permease protein [Halolactibacillus alkaliphilus]